MALGYGERGGSYLRLLPCCSGLLQMTAPSCRNQRSLILPAELQIMLSWTENGQSRWMPYIQLELLTLVPGQEEGVFHLAFSKDTVYAESFYVSVRTAPGWTSVFAPN